MILCPHVTIVMISSLSLTAQHFSSKLLSSSQSSTVNSFNDTESLVIISQCSSYPVIKLNLSRPAWENSVSSQEPQLIISLMSRSQLWTEENILIRNNILCKSDTETCQRVLIFLGLGITCFIIGWFNCLIIVNKSKVFLMFFGRHLYQYYSLNIFPSCDNYLVHLQKYFSLELDLLFCDVC